MKGKCLERPEPRCSDPAGRRADAGRPTPGAGVLRMNPDQRIAPYEPILSAGRKLYEDWLWCKFIPPDDLWDHLTDEDREAWERLAEQRHG